MIAVEQVAFLEILAFIAGALLFVGMSYSIGYLLRPQHPNTPTQKNQQRGDKNKVYSLHAPEVGCIAKGKAHKKYAFGSKSP